MDFNECNLRQLLEIALRFPRVNFKILFLILKTIIKNQDIEFLTPKSTFAEESSSDSVRKKNIDNEEPNSSSEPDEEKWKKIEEMENYITEMNENVKQLADRISELETLPAQEVSKTKKSEPKSDKILESEDEKTEPETEDKPDLELKKDSLGGKDSPSDEETKKISEIEKNKALMFVWKAGKTIDDNMQEIKKEVESLKESDPMELRTEMKSLQASNDFVVKKFDELGQDFETVMSGYSKLGMQVDELEKFVHTKIKIEDDVEKLKEQIDKLETYVYSGKSKSTQDEDVEKFQDEESLLKEDDDYQFMKGEVEKPSKIDKKIQFARIVKNLMTVPKEKKAEIRQAPIQPEFQKVKPTTMQKAYEKFITSVKEAHAPKEEKAVDLEEVDTEKAEKIDVAQLQGQTEIPDNAEIIQEDDERDPHIIGTVRKKLHKAVKAITLVQEMKQTQQKGRLIKAKEMEAFREYRNRKEEDEDGEEQQQLSAESIEILAPPSQQVSVEHPKSTPGKATLLFGDDRASQELKERIVMYIRSRLEDMEAQFMDKMHMVEMSTIELQDENEILKKDLQILKSRLAVVETYQNKFEGRLTAVEEKTILNDHHIEEMMITIDKKADRSDVMQGMSKKDMSLLEDRMLKINERTLLDIEELRNFLKEHTVSLRDELDEKVSGFDMDCRLEPLAGRLKRLERGLKDVSLKARILECQTMGPIEVKRYLHCEDGKRIKPLRRPISNWTSAAQSEMSIYHDRFFDEENAEKIEANIQKRMEDAVFRDSKRLIGGTYTKTKVERSN